MADVAPDDTLDTLLDYIAGSNSMVVCSSAPANYAGVAAVTLATVAIDSGDFTVADGDTDGRKVTVAAQSGVEVTDDGSAEVVALVNTGDSSLRYVKDADTEPVTDGGTVNVPAFDIEVGDPA